MVITQDQIAKIREKIRTHYNALIFRLTGGNSLSDAEIKELVDEGLIAPDGTEGALADAYYVGRGRNVSDPRHRPALTLNEFRNKYKEFAKPMTDVEKFAVEHVLASSGNHLAGLRDKARTTIEHIINNTNLEERNRIMADTIKPVLATGIAEDRALAQIASDLREVSGDFFRDWKRVTVTEISTAMNLGEADAIVSRNRGRATDEIYVYKRVNMDSALCQHCRKAYVMPDGITPRVFTLSTLQDHGTNYGKTAAEYLPTITPIHPNCRCALVELPVGWGFDENSGQSVYRGPDWNQHENQ